MLSSILTCSIQAKIDIWITILVKFLLSCRDVLLATQEPQKFKNLSQHDGPKMAISIGTYSIEGPDVGFMRGGSMYIFMAIFIYIYIYMYMCVYIYICRLAYALTTQLSCSFTLGAPDPGYTHGHLCTFVKLNVASPSP